MKYFVSDLHYGHRNVINYCNRPFKDIEEMHEYMTKTWNETVKPEDSVYCLGDFSLNPKWSASVTPHLNGIKFLVPGNHDACYPFEGRTKHLKMIERYTKDGWNYLGKEHLLKLSNGMNVLLSHLPYQNDAGNEYDNRYMNYKPIDKGMFLLCGHLHGRFIKYARMIDVGIDAHNMKLVSEDKIINIINDPRDFIPSHLTEFYNERNKDSK